MTASDGVRLPATIKPDLPALPVQLYSKFDHPTRRSSVCNTTIAATMRSFVFKTIHVFHFFLLAALACASTPKAPGLTYLYSVNITGGETIVFGQGPRGIRFAVAILGGSFSGPKLNGTYRTPLDQTRHSSPADNEAGTLLPVGGDWPLLDANNAVNGTVTLDVRQTFATDDGAFIQVFQTGASQPDGLTHVRLSYETGSEKYYWLNAVVAVGILRFADGLIAIDAFQVSFLRGGHSG